MEGELRGVLQSTNESLEALRDAHELLKKAHARQAEKLAAAEARAQEAEAARERTLGECRALYADWGAQLNAQALEFKAVEAQMVPLHQVQLARLAAADDLRQAHSAEVADLQARVDAARDALHQSRRECQSARAQLDDAVAERDTCVRMRDGQTAQIHELRKARLDEASRADAIRSDLTDQIRDLDRKLSEQRLTNGQLRAELDDVRADNDKVTASRAALELQHIQDVKQLQSQIGILSAQLDMAAARTSAANDARDQALAQLRDVELDCRRLRLQVLEQERCLAEERTAHDRERVEAKARYDQDRVQLEGGRAHLERQVENHLARIAQLERSAQDAVAQHEERTRTLEASCKDEVDAAQTALQALQGRVRDLEAALAKAQDQAALSDERLQAEVGRAAQQEQDARAALETSRGEVSRLEASLARVRAECDAATNAQRVLQAQVDERNVAVKAAQAACRQTEGDLKAANEAVARWQQKATSLEVDGARESAEWSAERTLLVGQVQDLDQRYRQAALKVKDLEAEAAQSQAALEATIRSLKKDRLKQKQTTKELRERLADVIRELAAVKQGASEGDPMPSIKELLEQQSESDAQIKDLMARIPI